ncbi:hypothetical protein [Paenibacillus stellifer]|uniref:hypothetical protein n=1 Tax=Paenibacillus stellifer TaxID=169760 RepID=UPI00056F44B7|nr:hypothetical protein [Paenibacillus stellifer]
MTDFFSPGPPANSTDPGGHKANHDVNASKLHREGAPGLLRQVSDLLIGITIIGAVAALLLWIF